MGPRPSWLDLLPAPTPDMSKRSVFTNVTPLPGHVSRETAVALLHDHVEMIEMNPLVIRLEPTTAPPNATPEEVKVMHWYSITDEIVYVPGTKVKGETTYKAGFYNLPVGLQTHVFAPAGVDIKTKWSVGGSLPGEEKESVELGLSAPREGLYIREDADLRCSVFVMNFVKRNLKRGHHVLCERLIKKALLAEEEGRGQMSRQSVFSSDADSILQRWDHLYTPGTSKPSIGSSMTTPNHSTPVDTSCACEGVNHEPSCTFYMHPGQPKRPSDAESQIQPASSRHSTIDMLVPPNEYERGPPRAFTSYSPAGPHPCSCTGGVHVQGCPQYPGLLFSPLRPRSAGPEPRPQLLESQQQTYQLALPVHTEQGSLSAHPQHNPYSFSKPQSPGSNTFSSLSGHTFRPQRPGEQAELPATTDWDTAEDIYSAVELKPDPLLIRTQHGHAVVMELDGEAEVARQYWQQRVGDRSAPEGWI